MHDDTKLLEAIDAWLKKNCKTGFGETYTGVAQADFEQFLRETSLLKSSPGRVAFGRALNLKGFGRKRRSGLNYIVGIELKEPPQNVMPRRQSRAVVHIEQAEVERKKRETAIKAGVKAELAAIKDRRKVKARMKKETKERNVNVKPEPIENQV